MDGRLFPHKPPYTIQSKRPSPSHQSTTQSLKFSSATLHLPPPSPPSFPLDSLLHHLVHLSSTPPRHANSAAARFPSLQVSNGSSSTLKSVKPVSSYVLGVEIGNERDGSVKLLCKKEVVLVNSIVEQPLPGLSSLLDSVKSELFRTDLFNLVKGLDDSGNWERAVFIKSDFSPLLENNM